MAAKKKLLASSDTLESLIKSINNFYYSSNNIELLEGGQVKIIHKDKILEWCVWEYKPKTKRYYWYDIS